MALEDTQLKPAEEKGSEKNRARLQTAEPYGDEPMHAESRVHFERHFAGQPLETSADHDANEAVRAERYARAAVDPDFARQQKIDVADEDKDEAAYARFGAPLLIGNPDDLDVAGNDEDAPLRERLVALGLRDPDDDSDLSDDEVELAQLDDDELNDNDDEKGVK